MKALTDDLQAHIDGDPAIALLCDLIRCRSLTPDDAGCQSVLASRLEELGFNCESLPFGDVHNPWARRGDGGPVLCLAGHTAAVERDPDVERLGGIHGEERLAERLAQVGPGKVVLQAALVDQHLAATRLENHPRDRALASAGRCELAGGRVGQRATPSGNGLGAGGGGESAAGTGAE